MKSDPGTATVHATESDFDSTVFGNGGYDLSGVPLHGRKAVELSISEPGDSSEREAERLARAVTRSLPAHERGSAAFGARGGSPTSESERDLSRAIGPGEPLDAETRAFMEPRFGQNFDDVRVHTDAAASRSARSMNALAYTLGRSIVFGAGQYRPGATDGRSLLAHELAHVVQQRRPRSDRRPVLQRFTATLEDTRIELALAPEPGDTDADLDRVLCAAIPERKIASRSKIDVSACFPPGTAQAMRAGPYNCADFVRRARGDSPASGSKDLNSLLTPLLWDELLKKGFRVRSFGVVKEDGKVEQAEGISWKQLQARMGDLVFMNGSIHVKKGAGEPDPAGDNFTASWDHVAFFVVRSRRGLDYHLAKDGDENPINVYHTGMPSAEGDQPGAYVRGAESLLAYLGLPGSQPSSGKPYLPGPMAEKYAALGEEERAQVDREVDQRFAKETGVTRKIDLDSPADLDLARTWLRIRDEVMAARP